MKDPVILWFRRDLRLEDHAALIAACESDAPVLPIFIYDETVESLGAAPLFRLGLSLESLARDLQGKGSQLILRRGDALEVITDVISETGARSVYWSRAYDPAAIARDTKVKAALKAIDIDAQSFTGHVMFEPWKVETKTGGFYRVYTPLWNTVRDRDVPLPKPAPGPIAPPDQWPQSDDIQSWKMAEGMKRGAGVLEPYCVVGAAAARDRLDEFAANRIGDYVKTRNLPGVKGTSGLSENLAWGEISPATCWHVGQRALEAGKTEAEVFLKELVWREFAYHLAFHTPHMLTDNWKPDWDAFPWQTEDSPDAIAWKQGRTGIPFVDAAMRELYVTGTMHNRGRMIVASYLTKHLMTHWKIGMDWFADCLIDWDPASNAMGWQWSAGSGPDATPYFRVFNPVTQLDKFDPEGRYARRWIAEGDNSPSKTALSYFDAIPRSWSLSAAEKYPEPVVPVALGRQRALDAYSGRSI